jgi:uncharacterized protein
LDAVKKPRSRILARLAIVRLFVFFFVLVTAYAGAQVGLAQLAKHAPELHVEAVTAAGTVVACIALLVIYALLVRGIERRPARELALLRGAPLAVIGVLIGLALFCTVYAILWAMGVARWNGFGGYHGLFTALIPSMIAAVGEELAIRGGVFRVLEDSLGTLIALLLSAALFGFLHAMNPGATLLSDVAIALEAGILLGVAYAVSRNLWLAIGLHFGWNFTEGGVFGAAVSGDGGGHGIVQVTFSGSDLLTGGKFGPEASVVAVGVCLAAAFVMLVMTIRRRHWVPLSFNMLLD